MFWVALFDSLLLVVAWSKIDSTMGSDPATHYAIRDVCHSEPRKLKIIHVGAGASGLLTAYKSERTLENFQLICYEKYAWT